MTDDHTPERKIENHYSSSSRSFKQDLHSRSRMYLAHVVWWDPTNLQDLARVSPGLDMYYTDPAQSLTTAGDKLYDLDHDLSDLSV